MTISSNGPRFNASTLFTLVFFDRSRDSDAEAAMNGPYLFQTRAEALETLWTYVQGRILACCADPLFEDAESLGLEIDNEEDDITPILAAANAEQREAIIDWYFEYSDDDETEAFYEITEHTPSAPESEEPLENYSVFGFYEETGQSFLDHVLAINEYDAMRVSAESRPDATYLCAMAGLLRESAGVAFAGEGVVDAQTILEQSDVFC
ncbi:hypothetical protein [Marinobacter sp.]|uniref:hypothetical protein n=1 Tax=Marinobacter sp. TaxID=50741 RepID=UPI003566B753